MATITFNSNFDPNPGFEEILDPGGTLAGDATTFTITNNTGGALDDYIFRLTGTGFTYNGSISDRRKRDRRADPRRRARRHHDCDDHRHSKPQPRRFLQHLG